MPTQIPSPAFRNSHCCGAMIFSQDGKKCLLVKQRDAQKWSFPKGSRRAGESPEQCMRREVLEETGLSLLSLRYLVHFQHHHQRYLVYMLQLQQPHDRLRLRALDTFEIEKACWLPVKDVKALPLNKITQRSLARWERSTISRVPPACNVEK